MVRIVKRTECSVLQVNRGQSQNSEESPFDGKLDKLVETAMNELHAPGLALGVIGEDQIWTKCYGISDSETGSKVTPKTLFSTGKYFPRSIVRQQS